MQGEHTHRKQEECHGVELNRKRCGRKKHQTGGRPTIQLVMRAKQSQIFGLRGEGSKGGRSVEMMGKERVLHLRWREVLAKKRNNARLTGYQHSGR